MNLTRKESLIGKTIKSINLRDHEDMSNDFLGQPYLYIVFTDGTEVFIESCPNESSYTLTEDGREMLSIWDRLSLDLISHEEYTVLERQEREAKRAIRVAEEKLHYLRLKEKYEA